MYWETAKIGCISPHITIFIFTNIVCHSQFVLLPYTQESFGHRFNFSNLIFNKQHNSFKKIGPCCSLTSQHLQLHFKDYIELWVSSYDCLAAQQLDGGQYYCSCCEVVLQMMDSSYTIKELPFVK